MSDMDAFWRALFIAMGATAGVGWALALGAVIAAVTAFIIGLIEGARR